ncbi:MAG: matrixin family metalloprotease [Candidatus Bathyarchaeia archaeon]
MSKYLLSMILILTLTVAIAASPVAQAQTGSITVLGVAWDHPELTVSINTRGGDSSYIPYVQAALDDWQTRINALEDVGSTGYASFAFVSVSSKKADIIVTLKKNTGVILGSASIDADGDVIKKVSIKLATENAMGQPLDIFDVQNIAAHEVGHALGLGHADVEDDLMHSSYDFVETGSVNLPSTLDLEAINYIYGNDGFDVWTNPPPDGSTYPPGTPPPSNGALTVNVTTDLDTYNMRDNVLITVTVTDEATNLVDAYVQVRIYTASGKVYGWDGSIGSDGSVNLKYKIKPPDGVSPPAYEVTAQASSSGYNDGTGSTTFWVNS